MEPQRSRPAKVPGWRSRAQQEFEKQPGVFWQGVGSPENSLTLPSRASAVLKPPVRGCSPQPSLSPHSPPGTRAAEDSCPGELRNLPRVWAVSAQGIPVGEGTSPALGGRNLCRNPGGCLPLPACKGLWEGFWGESLSFLCRPGNGAWALLPSRCSTCSAHLPSPHQSPWACDWSAQQHGQLSDPLGFVMNEVAGIEVRVVRTSPPPPQAGSGPRATPPRSLA